MLTRYDKMARQGQKILVSRIQKMLLSKFAKIYCCCILFSGMKPCWPQIWKIPNHVHATSVYVEYVEIVFAVFFPKFKCVQQVFFFAKKIKSSCVISIGCVLLRLSNSSYTMLYPMFQQFCGKWLPNGGKRFLDIPRWFLLSSVSWPSLGLLVSVVQQADGSGGGDGISGRELHHLPEPAISVFRNLALQRQEHGCTPAVVAYNIQ